METPWAHRATGRGSSSVAQATLQWRNLSWWKTEQAKPRGTRHAARYNSFLDVERYIVHTAGLSWQQTAQNRHTWSHMQESFIQAHDIPWSSGKQPSIQNLHQTGSSPKQHNLQIHDRKPPLPPRAAATPHHNHHHMRGKHRRRNKRRQRQKKDRAWQQLLQQLECSSSQ